MKKSSLVHKIWALLTHSEQRSAVLLLGLMIVGMALETLGIGVVVPAIGVLTDLDFVNSYPALSSMIGDPGEASRNTLIVGVMLGLIGIYLFKAVFLAYLAWDQARFACRGAGAPVRTSVHDVSAPAVYLPPATQLGATDPQRDHRREQCSLSTR